MTDSVHEFEELWAVEGDHAAEVSSDVDREDASPDALGVDKALEVHPEASDNSEATSKSTDDPQQETPSTRQHGLHGSVPVNMSRKRAPVVDPSPEEGLFAQALGTSYGADVGSLSAAQLGTSAPIRIPTKPPPRRGAEGTNESSGEKRFASTFVPPHLLEQQQHTAAAAGMAATYSGVSPSASLKRERLYQRNAILRSTGFIETNPIVRHSFVETLDTIKEGQFTRGVPRGPSQLEASALSQALDNMVEASGV